MRKLLLTMLVALLAVPVFADEKTPAVDSNNQVTVSFVTGNVNSDGTQTLTNPKLNLVGFSKGTDVISTVKGGTKVSYATISAESSWDRTLKTVTLDVDDLISSSITEAVVSFMGSYAEEPEFVDFTDQLADAQPGHKVSVDVSSIATNYKDEGYEVSIEISLGRNAKAGSLVLSGVSFEFFNDAEVPTEPSISWPAGTSTTAEFTIPVNEVASTVIRDMPTAVVVTNAKGATVLYESSNKNVATIVNFEDQKYHLVGIGETEITASITIADGDYAGTYTTTPIKLIVKGNPAEIKLDKTSYSATLGTTPTGYPTATVTPAGVDLTYTVVSGTNVLDVDAITGALDLKAVGKATIEVALAESVKRYTATPARYTVTVNGAIKWDDEPDPVTEIYYGQVYKFPTAVAAGTATPVITYSVPTGSSVKYENGKFTVIGVGESTIKATATIDGEAAGELSYTVEVKPSFVTIKYNTAAETIIYKLDEAVLPELVVTNPYGLTINLKPSDLTYTTSNPLVRVNEDNGEIVYESGFEPTGEPIKITATVKEGLFTSGAQTTFDLTVNPAIKWEGIAEETYTVSEDDGTLANAPKAQVADPKLVLKYSSSSDPEDAVTVDQSSGNVTLNGVGKATITAAAYNGTTIVQALSYNVVVTEGLATGVIYAKASNFSNGKNPSYYAKVKLEDKTTVDVGINIEGTNNNGVITNTDGVMIKTIDPVPYAYSSIKVQGNNLGTATLQTSFSPNFTVIVDEQTSENGEFNAIQMHNGLYYRIKFTGTNPTLTDITFTPNLNYEPLSANVDAYALVAVKKGNASTPDEMNNIQIEFGSDNTANFNAANRAEEGAYSEGQAAFVNFHTNGLNLYYICLNGENTYPASYATVTDLSNLGTGVTVYNVDPEDVPNYKDKTYFAVNWSTADKVKTKEFNKYVDGQFIRIGEDNFKDDLKIQYYVTEGTKASDLRTITFSNTTGVEDVMVDEVAGEAVYYNLQGVQIAHPAKGQIYVRVMGKKVDKVVF